MRILGVGESVYDMLKRSNGQSGSEAPAVDLGSGNGWSLLGGVLELILVIGLLAAVIYLLIKFLALRSNSGKMHPLMRTISVHALATNRTVQMISLENRIYVIGVGEDITLLEIITDEATVDRLLSQSPAPVAQELPEWMTKWLPLQKNNEPDDDLSLPFQQTLQSKLQSIKEQRKKIQEWDTDDK